MSHNEKKNKSLLPITSHVHLHTLIFITANLSCGMNMSLTAREDFNHDLTVAGHAVATPRE